MRIAVTHTLGSEQKFRKYVTWLQRGPFPVECETLSYRTGNRQVLERCDALVLTGGHDVEPSIYGGPLSHRTITDVDPNRDQFERQLIDDAMRLRLPLLGICRGCQLVNVHFGGTLIPDIEEAGYPSHKSGKDGPECRHEISVEKASVLSAVAGTTSGSVNSSHHQAVDVPGKGLVVTARSADGIVEAVELEKPGPMPFFLLVQWHPERMTDVENPFCKNLLSRFLFSLQKQHTSETHYTQKEHLR